MFDFARIKGAARQRLQQNRWSVVLVSLITALLGGAAYSIRRGTDRDTDILSAALSFIPREFWEAFVLSWFALSVAMIFYTILIGSVIKVGGAGWVLCHYRGKTQPIRETFASFKRYKTNVNAMLYHDLSIYLWSLLFVIPGLIKGLAYSMTPYLLNDNPDLPSKRVLEISDQMTKGYKGDLFLLQLSFIGWRLLGVLTLGILNVVYVSPYYDLTMAGVYEHLKQLAINSGKLSPREFGICQDEPERPAYEW